MEAKEEIRKIYDKNKKRYGYRRITKELENTGLRMNHKKVQRLLRQMGLRAFSPRAKYRSYKGEVGKTCDNLLLKRTTDEAGHMTACVRQFSSSRPDEKWTTDITEFHIAAGKLYLSPILDMNTREIIAYCISRSPNFRQICSMLDIAFEKHSDLRGTIFHSDQGWQYQMQRYQARLRERGIRQSMSRKGNCLDNSPMENFFGIMKNEMFYGHEYEFRTLDELEKAMDDYIYYYNNSRISLKLKGMSPIKYRQHSSDDVLSV